MLNNNIIHITLLGNCQSKALTWFIKQLDTNFDVAWLCPEPFRNTRWGSSQVVCGENINVITDTIQGHNRLRQTDFLIYQNMHSRITKCYNTNQLEKHAAHAKKITISSFRLNSDNPYDHLFTGMIAREKRNNTDIRASEIIKKHGDNVTTINRSTMHPNTFYFLEVVREICRITGWRFYTKDIYDRYLNEVHPFGR